MALETKATAYYAQYHLKVIPNGSTVMGGLSECVADFKASGQMDVMVDLALSSIALAVYANTHHDCTAATEAASSYHRLLQIVQERIAKVELPTLDNQEIDACLLTIFLMGRYEGVAHQPGELNPRDGFHILQSWSHHEGAMAILKVWSDKADRSPVSEIVKQTRRGQIRSAILRSRVLPQWLIDGTRFGEIGTELLYDCILVRVVLLRQALACSQLKENTTTPVVDQLNDEARGVEQELQKWFDPILRETPRHQKQSPLLTDSPKTHFYSNKVSVYQSVGHSGIWTQYYSLKMLILATRHRILELGSPDMLTYCTYRTQRLDCLDRLKTTAGELASTVPFCLERVYVKDVNSSLSSSNDLIFNKDQDIKPYLAGVLVWPLTIASSIAEVDQVQRDWFRAELTKIGDITGDGLLRSANTADWAVSI